MTSWAKTLEIIGRSSEAKLLCLVFSLIIPTPNNVFSSYFRLLFQRQMVCFLPIFSYQSNASGWFSFLCSLIITTTAVLVLFFPFLNPSWLYHRRKPFRFRTKVRLFPVSHLNPIFKWPISSNLEYSSSFRTVESGAVGRAFSQQLSDQWEIPGALQDDAVPESVVGRAMVPSLLLLLVLILLFLFNVISILSLFYYHY